MDRRAYRVAGLAFAVALAMTSRASAERLLAPPKVGGLPGPARRAAGISRVQPLILGRAALADLRAGTQAVVADFPLGADRTATLDLTRFEPFGPGARVEVVKGDGVHRVPLPDYVYFRGTIRDEPGSRAVVIAGRDVVHGLVATAGTVYPFGPDSGGGHRSYALRDVSRETYPPPGDFCGNDLHPEEVNAPAAMAGLVEPSIPQHDPASLVQADVAIETDYELWSKFGADEPALDYLTALLAEANAIYERDLMVRLRFSYIRLWATPGDPWTTTDTVDQIHEVRDYWNDVGNDMDAIAGPRDTVHFLSGKSVTGGVAYVDSICSSTTGFGVSQVFGAVSVPNQVWDLIVFTHELGHNFGSPHTHCYPTPVDRCYNAEAGCYSGAVVPSRGTLMSYCHLLDGGLANIDLEFGSVVSDRIGTTVAGASCLDPVPPCGNGVLETGEECDDGNTDSGDGCSATCLSECGNGALDTGEGCDDGNTTGGDGCSPTCVVEACGNDVLDAGEGCDDGNTTGGDGCSAVCALEVCGNAVLDVGEGCDDGNTSGGDGCSAACLVEACGNSVLDVGEGCDDGNPTGGDGCSAACAVEVCGNGTLDAGESCDDSNTTNGDGCSQACGLESCGNGALDAGEGCDDGNPTGGDGCSAACVVEVCGNGVLDAGEGCDDSNTTGGDGCSAACAVEGCGNGTLDAGEGCDDGNTGGGDGCSAGCVLEICGNAVLDVGEECDDGNPTGGDGCSAACDVEVCGNGVPDAGEACDDGNIAGGDGCSAACALESCGNAVLDPGEGCDDGNTTAGDGCSLACLVETCGDGVAGANEECDDGNALPNDGCSPTCQLEVCAVRRARQASWKQARMVVQRSSGADRLSVRGDFEIAVPFADLTPQESGMLLRFEAENGGSPLQVALTGGSRWTGRRGKRWTYRDRLGASGGIRKLMVVDRTVDGVPEVEVRASAHGGDYAAIPSDSPLVLTIVLGDADAGRAGACGRHAFGDGACRSAKRGSRIACR